MANLRNVTLLAFATPAIGRVNIASREKLLLLAADESVHSDHVVGKHVTAFELLAIRAQSRATTARDSFFDHFE